MLETFTLRTFMPYVGDTFRILGDSAPPVELTLTTATDLEHPRAVASPRAPFSLLFHGPSGPHLPQKMYRMAHATIGTFDLFLVPIGPDTQGMRYEAIFT